MAPARGATGSAHAAHRRRRRDLFSEAFGAEGAAVLAKACELGLKGIVSKQAGSLYRSGPSRSWLKTKNPAFIRTSPCPTVGSTRGSAFLSA
jgi:ATP-dependent DNA ligase